MHAALPAGMPDLRVDFREEGVGSLNHGVDVGDVEGIHIRQGRLVHGGAAHDEALACGLYRFVGLFEGIHAGGFGDRVSAKVEHYVLALRERMLGQREICGAAHDHRMTLGFALEILEIFAEVPGQIAFHPYRVIVGYRHYQTFFHTLQRYGFFVSSQSKKGKFTKPFHRISEQSLHRRLYRYFKRTSTQYFSKRMLIVITAATNNNSKIPCKTECGSLLYFSSNFLNNRLSE